MTNGHDDTGSPTTSRPLWMPAPCPPVSDEVPSSRSQLPRCVHFSLTWLPRIQWRNAVNWDRKSAKWMGEGVSRRNNAADIHLISCVRVLKGTLAFDRDLEALCNQSTCSGRPPLRSRVTEVSFNQQSSLSCAVADVPFHNQLSQILRMRKLRSLSGSYINSFKHWSSHFQWSPLAGPEDKETAKPDGVCRLLPTARWASTPTWKIVFVA